MANALCEVLLTDSELEPPVRDVTPQGGARIEFFGIVRQMEGECEIEGIEYEAHRAMAEHQLRMIGERGLDQFGIHAVVIQHRLGFVPAGQASLFLRVEGKHRGESFQAAQWIVDELKKKVPIWKHPRLIADRPSIERRAPAEKELMAQP